MTTPLTHATITRLEKIAVDNGFDQELPRDGEWLGFASTQAPLHLWLTIVGEGLFLAAVSQQNVALALKDHGTAFTNPLPAGAVGARGVVDIPALHRLVRRAFQLSKALPDSLLRVFEKTTASLPKTTEVERLIVQRVGQDIFRDGLMNYWEGRCAVTGLSVSALLRASHIKPWADCETDTERLDVFNGLLLAPHFDAAFDRGFITVDDAGAVVVASALADADRRALGISSQLRLKMIADGHRAFLAWHRNKVFLQGDQR